MFDNMSPPDEVPLGHSAGFGDFQVSEPTTNEQNRLSFDLECAALEGDTLSAAINFSYHFDRTDQHNNAGFSNDSFRPYADLEPPPSMQAMPLAPLLQQLQFTSGQMSKLMLAPSVTLKGGSMHATSSYTASVPNHLQRSSHSHITGQRGHEVIYAACPASSAA